jgi:hypothetical protein
LPAVDVAVVPIDDALGDQTVAAFVVRDGGPAEHR